METIPISDEWVFVLMLVLLVVSGIGVLAALGFLAMTIVNGVMFGIAVSAISLLVSLSTFLLCYIWFTSPV